MNGKLRALVVDDEPVPRRLLCAMVSRVEWMELAGEADRGAVAIDAINAREPDVVFLDIRLPDLSGFEVIEQASHRPDVVFTTAFDQYAIQALQLGALDYLVKPFGQNRFLEAAERVRSRVAANNTKQRWPARIYVRDRGIVVPVAIDRLERVDAQGDYSVLSAGGQTLLVQRTLGEMEAVLDPQRFVRVHRSHLINLDHVTSFRPFDGRRYVVVMRSGVEITASVAGTRLLRALVV
jgi:two-component system, LytTR family, response regulator